MFVITDNNSTKSFEKRDDLLYWLETMNAKARTTEELQKFSLSYLTTEGEIIEQREIFVPFSESIDEKLANFGMVKEKKKRFSFGKKKTPQQVQDTMEVIEEEVAIPQKKVVGMTQVLSSVVSKPSVKEEKKVSETPSQNQKKEISVASGGGKGFSGRILSLACLVLSLLSLALSIMVFWQAQQIKPLKQSTQALTSQLKEVQEYQASEHKIDLFARYFIPVYYSGDKEKVKTYFDQELLAKVTSLPSGQVQSVILEEVARKDKDFQVTYVVGLLQDKTRKNVRLSFTLHQDKSASHGWTVNSVPEESNY